MDFLGYPYSWIYVPTNKFKTADELFYIISNTTNQLPMKLHPIELAELVTVIVPSLFFLNSYCLYNPYIMHE